MCSIGSAAPFPSWQDTVTHVDSLALVQLHERHWQRAVSDLASGGDAVQHLTFEGHSLSSCVTTKKARAVGCPLCFIWKHRNSPLKQRYSSFTEEKYKLYYSIRYFRVLYYKIRFPQAFLSTFMEGLQETNTGFGYNSTRCCFASLPSPHTCRCLQGQEKPIGTTGACTSALTQLHPCSHHSNQQKPPHD